MDDESDAPAVPEPITLAEACARISAGDGRVELLAAFHHAMTAEGHLGGTEAEFRNRYDAFASSPVK